MSSILLRAAQQALGCMGGKGCANGCASRLAADGEAAIQEPHWWHSGFPAVPGGNVIVQEEDRGSIIAFTLRYVTAMFCARRRLRPVDHSSFDYQHELVNLMNPRAIRAPIAHPHSLPLPATPRKQHTISSLRRFSASSSTLSFKFFSSSHKPDPNREDSVWDDPEAYSAVLLARSVHAIRRRFYRCVRCCDIRCLWIARRARSHHRSPFLCLLA
jgi:1-phosphatidylinositol-3-phosphate 5-kinase